MWVEYFRPLTAVYPTVGCGTENSDACSAVALDAHCVLSQSNSSEKIISANNADGKTISAQKQQPEWIPAVLDLMAIGSNSD